MGICTQEQANEILAQLAKQDQWRADQMPSESDAIKVWMQAWLRLKQLGWRDAGGFWYSYDSEYERNNPNVTHWMPLPDSPPSPTAGSET